MKEIAINKTIKQFIKHASKLLNIGEWRAQKILINLVSAGILRSHTTEKTEFFTLS